MDYPRYDPQSAVKPLSEAEIDALDQLLLHLPGDEVMPLDSVDGYLSALCVAPGHPLQTLPSAQWLPAVWGGDGEAGMDDAAPFASKRQRKDTVVTLLRHLRHLQHQLANTPAVWEPIFSIAEHDEREWVDARDWCAGFMLAVDLQPAAWEGLWQDPVHGPALAPLCRLGGGLGGDDEGEDVEDVAEDDLDTVDRLSRSVPEAVLGLLGRRP